jgi:hypothetical protein
MDEWVAVVFPIIHASILSNHPDQPVSPLVFENKPGR